MLERVGWVKRIRIVRRSEVRVFIKFVLKNESIDEGLI